MRYLRHTISVLLFALLVCVAVKAQNFLFTPYLGALEFVELPPEGAPSDFLRYINQEVPLGRMDLHDVIEMEQPIEVRLKISPAKDWHLKFYVGDHLIGYLYFHVKNGQGQFNGMLINDELRSIGLSKYFLKYYVLFCRHYGLEPHTAVIYKPLMARVLMRFGFVPRKTAHCVLIRNGSGRMIEVYPIGFEMRLHLVESQHLRVLAERPPENETFPVFTHTRFAPPAGTEAMNAFWQRFEVIGGSYFLFRNDHVAQMVVPTLQDLTLPNRTTPFESPEAGTSRQLFLDSLSQ